MTEEPLPSEPQLELEPIDKKQKKKKKKEVQLVTESDEEGKKPNKSNEGEDEKGGSQKKDKKKKKQRDFVLSAESEDLQNEMCYFFLFSEFFSLVYFRS